MAKRKSRSPTARKIPKVRIVRYPDRPYQLRYDCPVEKRQIRISTGTREDEEAERQKAELQAKLLLGLSVSDDRARVLGPEMEWPDFREQYRVFHLTSVRDSTAAAAESRLDIAERILKPRTLGDVADPSALQQLQAKLLAGEQSRRGKPRSPHTVKGYMAHILAALNWANLQNWLPAAPKVRKIKTSRQKAMKGRPITKDEFQRMLEAVQGVVGETAAESWKYVLRGLWESALRINELMNVSWDKPGTIRPKWKDGIHPCLVIPAAMQKNNSDEEIPLLPGFEKLLLETQPERRTGWVFEPKSLQAKLGRGIRHKRPDGDWVGKVISRIGKAAKIVVEEADAKTGRPEKYASAHDLRRSCGEQLREAGVPPLVISRVMRHSSWETTQRHYAPGNVQSDAGVLSAILKTKPEDSSAAPDRTAEKDP